MEVVRRVVAHQRLRVVRLHGAVHRVLNHAIQCLHLSEAVEEARALCVKFKVEVWPSFDGGHGADVARRRADGFGQEGAQEKWAQES